MTRLWGMLMKKQRIAAQEIVPMDDERDTQDAVYEALGEICHKLDIARPMIMDKHWQELERFGRTRFSRDHFVEALPYDCLEIEILSEDKKHNDAFPKELLDI